MLKFCEYFVGVKLGNHESYRNMLGHNFFTISLKYLLLLISGDMEQNVVVVVKE